MKFFEFIRKALSEDNEHPSSGRLFNSWAVFWFVLVIAWGFVMVVFYYSYLILAYLGTVCTLLTLLLVNQTVKKNIENKTKQDKVD